MLPATKSQPKEMLTIVDKPVIQYVVEDAVRSGIRDILIVIGKGKDAIEHHFDEDFENAYYLEKKGKIKELEELRKISRLANIHFILQKELNGLGDAIRHGKEYVGNEPFAVLLGDEITVVFEEHLGLERNRIIENVGDDFVDWCEKTQRKGTKRGGAKCAPSGRRHAITDLTPRRRRSTLLLEARLRGCFRVAPTALPPFFIPHSISPRRDPARTRCRRKSYTFPSRYPSPRN